MESIFVNIIIYFLVSVLCIFLTSKLPMGKQILSKWFFKEMVWEDGGAIYQRLFKIRNWKKIIVDSSDLISTIFSRKAISSLEKDNLHGYLIKSCRSELTHWFSILASFLFVLWCSFPQAATIILIAFIINLPFVIVQRYKRSKINTALTTKLGVSDDENRKNNVLLHNQKAARVLIISAEKTGHGHKSITQALQHQLVELNPTIHISIIDGFSMGNSLLRLSGSLYNPLAVNMPLLWGGIYRLVNSNVRLLNSFISRDIRIKLVKCLNEVRPDVIVTVHGAFVGSVIDILEKEGMKTPVIPLIADLDNVSFLWADKRSKFTLCPSNESKQIMLSLGLAKEKLQLIDFPVRHEFSDLSTIVPVLPSKNGTLDEEKVSIMLINGSQGSVRILKMARVLLENSKCRISILAGNNLSLKRYLEKKLSPYIGSRVQIHGFTHDIRNLMLSADILVIRASPNVLMEAVNLCKPVIVVGALRGQEEKNPEFVERHNIGINCKDISNIPNVVYDLLCQNGKKLKEIYESQVTFRNPKATQEIATFIINRGCQGTGHYHLSSESSETKLIMKKYKQQGELTEETC